MFERFGDSAKAVLVAAVVEARTLDSNHVGTEHLLLAAVAANEALCASIGLVRSNVVDGLFDEEGSSPEGDIPFTPRAIRALELAVAAAGEGEVAGTDIIIGLVDEALQWQADALAGPQHVLDALARAGLTVESLRLGLNNHKSN